MKNKNQQRIEFTWRPSIVLSIVASVLLTLLFNLCCGEGLNDLLEKKTKSYAKNWDGFKIVTIDGHTIGQA